MNAASRPSERPTPNGEGMIDPVASLFSADRTLPAPVVAPEVNESEMTRWKASRASLFGESVKDPPPSSAAHAEPAEPLRGSRAVHDEPKSPVRAAPVAKIGQRESGDVDVAPPRMADPIELAPPPTARSGARRANTEPMVALAPPEPIAARMEPPRAKSPAKAPAPPSPAGARPDPTPPGGVSVKARGEKRAKPADAAKDRNRKQRPEPAGEPEQAPEARSRRIKRGPRPWMLATLGIAVVLVGGAAAVFLGVVPSPFEEPAPAMTRAPVRAPAAPPAPAAPAAAAAPAAPEAAPASEPVAVAAAKAEPQPAKAEPPAAAKPAPQPAKAEPPAAKPEVAAAPKPALAEPAADASNDALIALARRALSDDNAAQAEALARRALAKEADDHHAMEVLARALLDQDRGKEAVSYARRMVEKRKKRVPYRLLLGDALLMTGDAAGAKKEWQAALEIEPGNREAQQRLR